MIPRWLALLTVGLVVGILAVGGTIVWRFTAPANVAAVDRPEVDAARAAVDAAPSDASAWVELGWAYQNARLLKDALKSYDEALRLAPREPRALYNSAVVLIDLGGEQDGEARLRSALEVDPGNELAAAVLAKRLIGRKAWADAAAILEPAVAASPDYADLRLALGQAYEQQDKMAQAAEQYREALRFAPDLKDAKDGLARAEKDR